MLKNKGGMFSSIIQIKDKELLISGEQTIKKEIVSIWDIKRYQCIMSISGIFCHSANSIVQLDERNVLIGGLSKIVVLNFYTGKIEKVIQDSNIKHVTCICLLKEGKFILCGCEEGKFLLYDRESKILTQKQTSHKKTITNIIKINDNIIASCSFNNTIKIWSY